MHPLQIEWPGLGGVLTGMISAAREFVRKREAKAEALVYWCFAGVFLTMPMGTSPPILLGALGALIWLVSGMAFRVKGFFRQSWTWPVLAFIALSWIGLLYTADPGGFGLNYAGKTYYWIFCFALASVSFEIFESRRLIQAFLAGCALNAGVGILQLAGIVALKENLCTGLTRGYNTLSIYLILAILLCAFYLREARKWEERIGLSLLTGLYLFHLILIRGRAGYVTFIVLLPLVLKTLFTRLSTVKILLLWALILGSLSMAPPVKNRLDKTLAELRYHMTAEPGTAWGREYTEHQDRFYMWAGAWQIFLEHPVIGVGTGGYPAVLKKARQPGDPVIAHPHNSILHMAASYGLVGLLVFVGFFGEMVRNGWRERHTATGHLVFCTALVFLVHGLFNTPILDAGGLVLLSMVVGLQRSLQTFQTAK